MSSNVLTIILALIAAASGSMGIEYLKYRRELKKSASEDDKDLNDRMNKHIEYVDKKLQVSEDRYDKMREFCVELQRKEVEREALIRALEFDKKRVLEEYEDLKEETTKRLQEAEHNKQIVVDELNIIKNEYGSLKEEYVTYKARLETEFRAVQDQNVLLVAEVERLGKAQTCLAQEVHDAQPTPSA